METTLRAPSLCPDIIEKRKRLITTIERHIVLRVCLQAEGRRKKVLTFFAIQRTLSS